MDLQAMSTAELLGRIESLQAIQKTHGSKTPAWQNASELLQPCFAEMARRTANSGKPFTEEDDAAIRRMHADGATVAAIAADRLRTAAGIEARLERLGLRAGTMARKQANFLGGMK
jgi:hypothetical protein